MDEVDREDELRHLTHQQAWAKMVEGKLDPEDYYSASGGILDYEENQKMLENVTGLRRLQLHG